MHAVSFTLRNPEEWLFNKHLEFIFMERQIVVFSFRHNLMGIIQRSYYSILQDLFVITF